jgi:hypothetical protein
VSCACGPEGGESNVCLTGAPVRRVVPKYKHLALLVKYLSLLSFYQMALMRGLRGLCEDRSIYRFIATPRRVADLK